MKDSYTRSEVKNAKHGASIGGFILGAIITLAVGVLVKKTTDANIVDGSTNVFDNLKEKTKEFIDSRKGATRGKRIASAEPTGDGA